ncbi:MAG: GAF domain-containing protein, partial [Leptolyngbyaceae bacterium]|nr:GAF domain-containing protein [Leptolyngbyaceae bacterium]
IYLDAAFVRIWSFNQSSNLLELQAIAGQHSHTEDFPVHISPGISIIGFIAQTRQPYISQDVNNDMCIGAKVWLKQEGFTTFAGYPLIVEDRLVGVLALFSTHCLTEATQNLLGWVANSIAVAIDRTWAREELLSRREALLLRLANQIRNSLDLDTILGTAVNEIRSLLQIDRCYFLWCWPDPERPSLTITHEARNPDLPALMGELPAAQVLPLAQRIMTQDMMRSGDIANDSNLEPGIQSLLASLGITSQLLLPLETHSGQLGAVVCSHCRGSRPWSESEVELLQAVTDQLAIAMDQAELYAQTRATARAAQSQAQQLIETVHKLKETQAQLVQTEKMSSLGQMVAGIAHEINNPVNFIAGNLTYANNYLQDLLSLVKLYQECYPNPVPAIQERTEEIDLEFLIEDLSKLLSSMQIGTERIRQIVLSLRNFSRLDEADKKPVNIHEGIDSTLLILQSRLKAQPNQAEIQIIKQYGELPVVECYAGQLNQVFMNILSNAIDALEDRPAPRTITITTEILQEKSPTRQHILIRIRDNGSGMPESVRQKLFDPFFTTKPVGKGTGLGLSISYQIVVEKHGGLLKCLSEPGQGSEFWIQIPVAIAT